MARTAHIACQKRQTQCKIAQYEPVFVRNGRHSSAFVFKGGENCVLRIFQLIFSGTKQQIDSILGKLEMSLIWLLLRSRVSTYFLIYMIILSCFPGLILSAVVTLDSVEIFKTHEWFKAEPTVYFMCKGENKTVLPDVKKEHVVYTFKGEESWQPLVELSRKKCKRCGFYEEDIMELHDVFDEWEFCPSEFTAPDGKYIRSKDKEFNATFSCIQCVALGEDSNHAMDSHSGGNEMHLLVVILISALVSIVVILGMMAACKYWLKKKREKEQARFLKLFEDGDDIEDELGLGSII